MDVVRKLIIEKLAEIGLNMSEASVKIGRNHAYLQQFLKRGIPTELHERDRIKLAGLLKVPEDDLRGPSTPLPKRSYEKKLSSSRESLIDHATQLPQSPAGPPARSVSNAELFGAIDLPIFGTAQGGQDGALIVSNVTVDWVARPAVLLRVRDGYGMIVGDDTMSPEHKAGSIALINPHLPPRVGDSCAFRGRTDEGVDLCLIREYRGQTETHWKVHQHHPAKDSSLKKSDWPACHRTVGSYFP